MELADRLKQYEGTKQYQQSRGMFRNDKFYQYYDSLGKPTIGYGHLLTNSEVYPYGISEDKANALLNQDIKIARMQYYKLELDLPQDWQDFMIIMIFQLGYAGVLKFKKMIAALKAKDYKEAIKQAKDSLWYKQTPNRLNQMIEVLTNK
uniref:glycoside hydrolase family protein n=1 Tax=Rahnella sp. RFA10(1/100) TaxID=2511202 RepID=UPI001021C0C6|nr:glycoside hydrolase family protein [Rahnella sp. RFA10(1/100)]